MTECVSCNLFFTEKTFSTEHSYKRFTIVIYDSRVVLTTKLSRFASRVFNYDHRVFKGGLH